MLNGFSLLHPARALYHSTQPIPKSFERRGLAAAGGYSFDLTLEATPLTLVAVADSLAEKRWLRIAAYRVGDARKCARWPASWTIG